VLAKIARTVLPSLGGGIGLTAIGAMNRVMAVSPLNENGELSIGEYFTEVGNSLADYFSEEGLEHFAAGTAMILGLKGVSAVMRSKYFSNSSITKRFFSSEEKAGDYMTKLTEETMKTGSNIGTRVGQAALNGAKSFLAVGPSFFAIDTAIQNVSAEINSLFTGEEHDFFEDFTWEGKENGMGFFQSALVSTLQMGKLGLWLGPMMPMFQKGKNIEAGAFDKGVAEELANLTKFQKGIKQFVSGPATIATILSTSSYLSEKVLNLIDDKFVTLFSDMNAEDKQTAMEALANDMAFFVLMNIIA